MTQHSCKDSGGPARNRPQYKKARQMRSTASEAIFLQAAEEIFREHGYNEGSVAAIIKCSGQSTGSFYHRFGDKRQLLQLMLDRYAEQVDLILGKEGPVNKVYPDLASMLTAFASLVYTEMFNNPGMYRAALELSQKEPEIWQALRELTAKIVHQVAESAPSFRIEITAKEPNVALLQAAQLIVMILFQTLPCNGLNFPREKAELIALCVDAAVGILCSSRQVDTGANE